MAHRDPLQGKDWTGEALEFSEVQITYALRQEEAGMAVDEVCRQLGVSQATFYVWKKTYAHLGVSELRRLW